MGMQYTGGYAELARLPSAAAVPIPDTMPYEIAAAFPSTYSTPHIALTRRANLRAGETLLVLGAAGGIGLAAVEIGKALGATVIAGASTDEKLALASSKGADYQVNYRTDNLRGRVREITGGNMADVIFDPVGGGLFRQALRCLAWEGRLLIAGFASGEIPEVSVNRLLIQNTALVGIEWGTYMKGRPDLVRQSFETLLVWWEDGKIAPHVSAVYPLARTPEVLRRVLDRKTTGRVIIQPGK
jgi:NADPH2:quinone reductase